MMRILALVLSLVSCTKVAAPTSEEPSPGVRVRHLMAVERLVNSHMVDGWVVSRDGEKPHHLGDSLLWTGLALGILPCDKAELPAAALRGMFRELGGGMWRHPSLPTDASMDGAMGVYWGIARHQRKCAGEWHSELTAHRELLRSTGNKLNRAGSGLLPPGFDYLPPLLDGDTPPDAHKALLERLVGAWALATKLERASCYRAHLGLLALDAAQVAGQSISPDAKGFYCLQTRPMKIPLIDHWCGRPGLGEWVAGFEYNVWEYRHQRCGAWETADGNGYETPALDLLMGMAYYYGLGER